MRKTLAAFPHVYLHFDQNVFRIRIKLEASFPATSQERMISIPRLISQTLKSAAVARDDVVEIYERVWPDHVFFGLTGSLYPVADATRGFTVLCRIPQLFPHTP